MTVTDINLHRCRLQAFVLCEEMNSSSLYPQAPAGAKIHAVQVDGANVSLEDLPPGSKLIHLVRHGQAAHNRTLLYPRWIPVLPVCISNLHAYIKRLRSKNTGEGIRAAVRNPVTSRAPI